MSVPYSIFGFQHSTIGLHGSSKIVAGVDISGAESVVGASDVTGVLVVDVVLGIKVDEAVVVVDPNGTSSKHRICPTGQDA